MFFSHYYLVPLETVPLCQQEKSAEPVFVHGKSSGRGNDIKEDKYEKKIFNEDRPPRFNKVISNICHVVGLKFNPLVSEKKKSLFW